MVCNDCRRPCTPVHTHLTKHKIPIKVCGKCHEAYAPEPVEVVEVKVEEKKKKAPPKKKTAKKKKPAKKPAKKKSSKKT